MEAFNYRLQRVLDFKLSIEEKKKEEFVKALKFYLKEEKVLLDLVRQKDNAMGFTGELKTIVDFQSYSRYMEFLDNKIEDARYKLSKAEEQLNIKNQELVKSTADRKVLENLKEKAREEFNLEVNKMEQRLNDDFALFAYIKRERR